MTYSSLALITWSSLQYIKWSPYFTTMYSLVKTTCFVAFSLISKLHEMINTVGTPTASAGYRFVSICYSAFMTSLTYEFAIGLSAYDVDELLFDSANPPLVLGSTD